MIKPSQDFYWERLFISSFIGAGGGAAIAYLLGTDYKIYVGLGIAIGIMFSTAIQADKVYGIKPEKKQRPINLEKIEEEQFEEQIPDDFKEFK